jgi:mono/diheme cytochrome c family protein
MAQIAYSRGVMRWLVIVSILCTGCGAAATPPTSPPPSAAPLPTPPAPAPLAKPTPLMSEPFEYDIANVSRDAGEAIFTRTGIGDPYRTGVPYPIWLALLRAYPARFGATPSELAAKFGFIARAAVPDSTDPDLREGLPLGMHLTSDPITGVQFVVTNCALCHAARLRWPGGEALVIGLGNKLVQVHAYDAAFSDATTDASFTADHLAKLAADAADEHATPWPAQYRDVFVGATVEALRARAKTRADLLARTHAGPPGRVAVIETFALAIGSVLDRAIAVSPNVGWAKVPDVIGFANRLTLSWDGFGQGSMDILAVEADFAAGVRAEWFTRHLMQGPSLGAYLRHPAPRPKFPRPIDAARAARGKKLFDANCSACHGHYAADGRAIDYSEQIVTLADIGTDPARSNAITTSFVDGANAVSQGVTRTRASTGYVPPVLTNVWARAPYGHAGQWPSLSVLATDPDKRATHFVIAPGALYDLAAVGVASHPPAATLAAGETLVDATQPGFGVGGHPFLAELGATDAAAVVEYLKTL